MDAAWRSILWSKFGAAMSMLENAVLACPEELWSDRSEPQEFWYAAYHALFWLDLYLYGAEEGFAPPAPFTLIEGVPCTLVEGVWCEPSDEVDPVGVLPTGVYTKKELLTYLQHCRQQCRATIDALTDEKALQCCRFPWGDVPFAELMIYNLRHVQEHASQLSLLLGQKCGSAPNWVARVAAM